MPRDDDRGSVPQRIRSQLHFDGFNLHSVSLRLFDVPSISALSPMDEGKGNDHQKQIDSQLVRDAVGLVDPRGIGDDVFVDLESVECSGNHLHSTSRDDVASIPYSVDEIQQIRFPIGLFTDFAVEPLVEDIDRHPHSSSVVVPQRDLFGRFQHDPRELRLHLGPPRLFECGGDALSVWC